MLTFVAIRDVIVCSNGNVVGSVTASEFDVDDDDEEEVEKFEDDAIAIALSGSSTESIGETNGRTIDSNA